MITLLITLAWVVGYIFVGVAILALNMFLNKKNDTFHGIFELLGMTGELEDSGDAFVGLCFLFALAWPFILFMEILVLPFAYIKYLSNNNWNIKQKGYSKKKKRN